MTEESQNMPNFANRPQLDKHPNQLTPEVAQKDSALNQDLIHCAEWLKSNKDKAGSDEYMQNLNALSSMAEKGYPMAEFEYAKFLADEGELNKAANFFDRARKNENAGPELKKEIQATTASSSNEEDNTQANDDVKPDHTKSQHSSLQAMLSKNSYEDEQSGKVAAYEQAKLIKARQEQNEGYLPHRSYVPSKKEEEG